MEVEPFDEQRAHAKGLRGSTRLDMIQHQLPLARASPLSAYVVANNYFFVLRQPNTPVAGRTFYRNLLQLMKFGPKKKLIRVHK